MVGERGGRLVHLDDPRVDRERLHDLDDLLLGDGEGAHRGIRIDAVDAELLEQGPGLADHGLAVDEPGALGLAAEEHVLRDGALGQEVELLEHGREARAGRPGRGA